MLNTLSLTKNDNAAAAAAAAAVPAVAEWRCMDGLETPELCLWDWALLPSLGMSALGMSDMSSSWIGPLGVKAAFGEGR